jgi:hypothetical protein
MDLAGFAPNRRYNYGSTTRLRPEPSMRISFACAASALISLSTVSAYADPTACRAEVFAATQKAWGIPSHSFRSQTEGSKVVSTSEMINADNKSYIKLDKVDLGPMKLADEGWSVSRVSPQESLKMIQESFRDAAKETKNYQCAHVRDETIDGVAASVYAEHAENDDVKSDAQTWISKSQGLLVKQVMTVDDTTVTTRYVYTGVQAPSNAKGPDQ